MYAVCNTLSRLRAHGTPHQSGNMPTLLLTRLASAPAWASACSLGAYLYLWVRGIGHAVVQRGTRTGRTSRWGAREYDDGVSATLHKIWQVEGGGASQIFPLFLEIDGSIDRG